MLQELHDNLYDTINSFLDKLSIRYGYNESGRSEDTGRFGFFDVIGPDIRDIYEVSPFIRLDPYKDVGNPSGELEVEYRTVRRSIKSLSFPSDLGNILGNSGLEETPLNILGTDMMVSKKFLDASDEILLDMSLVS
jgi:hypothetical protein